MGQCPRHHAARVEAAIASGQAARSALVASWRRSSRLHHLDPAGPRPPLRLSEAELRQARERVAPLLAAAQAAMDRLYQAVGAQPAAACCSPTARACRSTAVARRPTIATFESWGLWTGALWSEEHEGTNGIGTCVVEQRAADDRPRPAFLHPQHAAELHGRADLRPRGERLPACSTSPPAAPTAPTHSPI